MITKKEIIAQGVVNAFNKQFDVGQNITVIDDEGVSIKTVTISKAIVYGLSKIPSIEVEGLVGQWELSRIIPMTNVIEFSHPLLPKVQ
jgi:hypothetical protein